MAGEGTEGNPATLTLADYLCRGEGSLRVKLLAGPQQALQGDGTFHKGDSQVILLTWSILAHSPGRQAQVLTFLVPHSELVEAICQTPPATCPSLLQCPTAPPLNKDGFSYLEFIGLRK
jgi:hypothetical protein